MALSEADIERYARQIIIPTIGASGQEKLLAGRVLLLGDEAGVRQARLYLESSGVTATEEHDNAPFSCAIVAGWAGLSGTERNGLLASGAALVWYELGSHAIRAGVHTLERPAPPPAVPSTGTASCENDEVLHEIAACDAANAAIAIILGWPPGEPRWEVPLA